MTTAITDCSASRRHGPPLQTLKLFFVPTWTTFQVHRACSSAECHDDARFNKHSRGTLERCSISKAVRTTTVIRFLVRFKVSVLVQSLLKYDAVQK